MKYIICGVSNTIYNSDFSSANNWYGFNTSTNIKNYYDIENNIIRLTNSYSLPNSPTDSSNIRIERNVYNGIKYYRYFTVDTLPISTELFITMNTKQYQAKQLTYIPDVNNDQNQEEEVEE